MKTFAITRRRWPSGRTRAWGVNENCGKKTPKMLLSFFSLVRLSLKPWSHLIKSLSIRRKIVHTWKTYEWSGHHHRFYAGSEGPASMCICRAEARGERKRQCRARAAEKKSLNSEQWRRRQNRGGGRKNYVKKSLLFVDNQKPIYHHLSIWIFFLHPQFAAIQWQSLFPSLVHSSHGKINNAAAVATFLHNLKVEESTQCGGGEMKNWIEF